MEMQTALDRWRKAKPKRRKISLQIMRGERDYDPAWPNWVVYDIRAEIALIEQEQAAESAAIDKAKREKEAREQAKSDFLL